MLPGLARPSPVGAAGSPYHGGSACGHLVEPIGRAQARWRDATVHEVTHDPVVRSPAICRGAGVMRTEARAPPDPPAAHRARAHDEFPARSLKRRHARSTLHRRCLSRPVGAPGGFWRIERICNRSQRRRGRPRGDRAAPGGVGLSQPGRQASACASSQSSFRSFGSCAITSRASPGEICSLSAANTASVIHRASRVEGSPASRTTRS